MYKLRIVQSGKEYDYEPGASLLEILLAQNIFIDNPCNGKGVCGKCKVRIVSHCHKHNTLLFGHLI